MTEQDSFSLRDLIRHKLRLYFGFNSDYNDDNFASRYRVKIYKQTVYGHVPKYKIRIVEMETNFNYRIRLREFMDPSDDDILAVAAIVASQFVNAFKTRNIAKVERMCEWINENA